VRALGLIKVVPLNDIVAVKIQVGVRERLSWYRPLCLTTLWLSRSRWVCASARPYKSNTFERHCGCQDPGGCA
jgi:hypothetical protein